MSQKKGYEMNTRNFSNIEILWKPSNKSANETKKFMKLIEYKYNTKLGDYWDLHKWSIEHISEFWNEFWHASGIICSKTFDQVVDINVPMENSPPWFEGARLNFAENLLKYRDDHVALISASEDREVEITTYAELYEEARLYAASLRKFGLKKGDVVACYMSNRKEAIIAMIAVTSIGAIFTGTLPQLGAQAVINRFQIVQPKLLFTMDRYQHNKEEIEMLLKLQEIADALPSLEKIVIVPSKEESKSKDISRIMNSCFLEEFLSIGKEADGSVVPMMFEQVSFSHPVFINYTSGTTGLPKALIIGAASLLTVTRDFGSYGSEVRERVWFSVSPVGWVSWNMYSSLHFLGCTVVSFEGVPYFLSQTSLWDMIDEFKVTHITLTPSVLDDMEKKGCLPTDQNSLSSLETVVSAGSVVKPQNYDFVCKKVKKGVLFYGGFGCTELMGFSAAHDPSLPVYRGELTAPCLGVDLQCLDEEGKPVVGEAGEMVIMKPFPSLVLGMWGDGNGSAFKEKYFSKFPGKFSIGDLAIINPITKGFIACGRSDATLKPGGCRFGSSEIYNIVESFPEILDSICVAQYSKDLVERAVLFLKIKEGYYFSNELVSRIREMIEQELTVHHIPEIILETQDIPCNANGKKMELIVKKIINNMPYNPESVVNPECLQYFHNVPDLQGFEG